MNTSNPKHPNNVQQTCPKFTAQKSAPTPMRLRVRLCQLCDQDRDLSTFKVSSHYVKFLLCEGEETALDLTAR